MIKAHATDKEIRHLTQVSFDKYLVQMNWVNECIVSHDNNRQEDS